MEPLGDGVAVWQRKSRKIFPTRVSYKEKVRGFMMYQDQIIIRGLRQNNLDVMKQADWLIDVGPDGGTAGGEIVFTGTPREMAENGDTITAEYLRKSL